LYLILQTPFMFLDHNVRTSHVFHSCYMLFPCRHSWFHRHNIVH
jgi:hypothetical protein